MKIMYLTILLTTMLFSNNQQELIMDLEKSLMAVCCWSGTVYDHGNSDMESKIAIMVQSGNTKTEIMDHFVNQYGERVLAVPVMAGFNMFAWITPILTVSYTHLTLPTTPYV